MNNSMQNEWQTTRGEKIPHVTNVKDMPSIKVFSP